MDYTDYPLVCLGLLCCIIRLVLFIYIPATSKTFNIYSFCNTLCWILWFWFHFECPTFKIQSFKESSHPSSIFSFSWYLLHGNGLYGVITEELWFNDDRRLANTVNKKAMLPQYRIMKSGWWGWWWWWSSSPFWISLDITYDYEFVFISMYYTVLMMILVL